MSTGRLIVRRFAIRGLHTKRTKPRRAFMCAKYLLLKIQNSNSNSNLTFKISNINRIHLALNTHMVYKRKRGSNRRRRFKRRYTRKRRFSRRKRFSRPSKQHLRHKGPNTVFPDRLYTTLVYQDYINATPANGSTAETYLWHGNSIYDPYITGTGHQPRYHDTFSVIYDNYIVHASKISVKAQVVYASTAAPPFPFAIAVCPSPGVTALALTSTVNYSKMGDASEMPNTKYSIFKLGGTGQPGTFGKVRNFMSTRKLFGMPQPLDEEFQAGFGFSPQTAQAWAWNVFIGPIDNYTFDGTAQIKLQVRIKYFVEMRNAIVPEVS